MGSRPAEGAHEAAAVADALDVGGNDPRLVVLSKVVKEVHLIEVQAVTVADDLAEAEPPLGTVIDQLHGVAAALGQEADASCFPGEVSPERYAPAGVVQPHAVGAYDADAGALAAAQELLFQPGRILPPGLAEASCEEVDGLDVLLATVLHEGQHTGCRNAGDDVVNSPRYL